MDKIKSELGQAYTAKDVADYTGLSVTTVRSNYSSLGGVRVGTRYIFFEKKVIDAILRQDKKTMGRPGSSKGIEKTEVVQDQKRGQGVGRRDQKAGFTEKQDRHNLLD